jgi:hypothetical protein
MVQNIFKLLNSPGRILGVLNIVGISAASSKENEFGSVKVILAHVQLFF